MTQTTVLDEMFEECTKNCTDCSNICALTAVEPDVLERGTVEQLKLLVNCAEICETSLDFLKTRSVYHRAVCRACSEVCDGCAQMCEQSGIDAMVKCAQVCRKCAESCSRMAGMT